MSSKAQSKNKTPHIKAGAKGIKLTENQKAVLAEFADSEAFSIIRTKLFPQRRDQIKEAALSSPDLENLRAFQGRAREQDEFLGMINKIKREFEQPEDKG